MTTLKNRFNQVFNNEAGSPMVETVIAIAVMLCIVSMMLVLGGLVFKYQARATSSVQTLA